MRSEISSLFISTILIANIFGAMTLNLGEMSLSSGRIIYVDDDNTSGIEYGTISNPFNTIQEGIDAASDGDTVYVFNGTYYENVIIDKSLTLQGENRDNTLIDGGGLHDVVNVTANYVNIFGFKIINSGSRSGYPIWDAGIDIKSDYNTVYNCNISNNNADGIFLKESSNNILFNNYISSNRRAAIVIESGSKYNHMYNSTLVLNGFHGIWILYGSYENVFEDNFISKNKKFGVVIVGSDRNIVRGNTISLNKDYGLYLDIHPTSDNEIYHNNIISNAIQAIGNGDNIWDDGYPSGGNYWSNYHGNDYYNGVN